MPNSGRPLLPRSLPCRLPPPTQLLPPAASRAGLAASALPQALGAAPPPEPQMLGDVAPPELPLPLGPPPGRGDLDWSWAGYRDGAPLPSAPPRWNVKDFGAVGDGVADDTPALAAALAAAHADPAGGGVVLLPAGTYVLRQPLRISRSGIVLRGEGVSACLDSSCRR